MRKQKNYNKGLFVYRCNTTSSQRLDPGGGAAAGSSSGVQGRRHVEATGTTRNPKSRFSAEVAKTN